MVTTATGQAAEIAVAKYLTSQGFSIIARNWKNRWCEIDLIALKNKTVHFVEVKYRAKDLQGTGFDYIGSNKLRQLQFAVNFWVSENNLQGDCRLVGAQVSGLDFEQIQLTELD